MNVYFWMNVVEILRSKLRLLLPTYLLLIQV